MKKCGKYLIYSYDNNNLFDLRENARNFLKKDIRDKI